MASDTSGNGSPLPRVKRLITANDSSTGKAVVHQNDAGKWVAFDDNAMEFNVIYTNDQTPDLSDAADLKEHEAVMAKGELGLVKPGGTVCRIVDFKPSYTCLMHRTTSIDYGIVLEGEVDMLLDDGSSTRMNRGDVAVQRATMHAWRNASSTNWARMIFVLQDIKPLHLHGELVKEDLSAGGGEIH